MTKQYLLLCLQNTRERKRSLKKGNQKQKITTWVLCDEGKMFLIFKWHKSRYLTRRWKHLWAWLKLLVHMPNLIFGNTKKPSYVDELRTKWEEVETNTPAMVKKCSGTNFPPCVDEQGVFLKINSCLNWPNTETCLWNCIVTYCGKRIQSISTMRMLRRVQVQTNMNH